MITSLLTGWHRLEPSSHWAEERTSCWCQRRHQPAVLVLRISPGHPSSWDHPISRAEPYSSLLSSATRSTCIALFCSLPTFISFFLPILILWSVSWSLFKDKKKFHILPAMTLSNPITCGHLSTPDTSSSSFLRLNCCQTLQHTQSTGQGGQPEPPHSCQAEVFISTRHENDSAGYQRVGSLTEPSAAALGSGWAARIYLYSLSTAAATSFLALLQLWKKIYYCSHRAKQRSRSQAKQSKLPTSVFSHEKHTRLFPAQDTSLFSSALFYH